MYAAHGTLIDARTNTPIRPATREEREASDLGMARGESLILVTERDGRVVGTGSWDAYHVGVRACYVIDSQEC